MSNRLTVLEAKKHLYATYLKMEPKDLTGYDLRIMEVLATDQDIRKFLNDSMKTRKDDGGVAR